MITFLMCWPVAQACARRGLALPFFSSAASSSGTGAASAPEGVKLKNVEAILATTEQSPSEHYRIGQNVKAFVLEVRRATRGPEILVSRTHKGFLKRLFGGK